jgi:hypothetical protein
MLGDKTKKRHVGATSKRQLVLRTVASVPHTEAMPNAALPGNDDDVNGPMRKIRAETDRKRRRRHRTIRDRYPEAHTTW